MSIQDAEGKDIVTIGSLHEAVFKIVIWMAALAIPGGALATWNVLRTQDNHEFRITHLERITERHGITQSVNVGSADAQDAQAADSARTYLITEEVATREGVSDRTVTEWINEGRILPPPQKAGREWVIAADYRILQLSAANSGKPP